MPGSTLNLAILINAVDQASSVLGGVGSALAGITIAAVAMGAQAVQAAGNFQEGMTSLVTGAGEAQSNLAMVSQGILNMAVATGTSTQQLTNGMYMIESAGYHGAAGLQVLQTAAEGAKVGAADLGVTANALTTILTDYHMSADQSTAAMNGLITTVASGKTHLQDLASSMGSVLPLASSLGIAFPQVAGAIATMTNAGMSAQQASKNLANAIRSLAAPNAVAQKSMKEVGLTAQQLKDALANGGLTGALQLIEQHVGKTFPAGSVQAVEAFKSLMGGATGYNVALMLGGKNMQTFEGDVSSITKAMSTGGSSVQGWSLVQQDFNFKLAQAQQAVNVLMIALGSALLPVLSKLFSQITPLITQFVAWNNEHHALEAAAQVLGTAISVVVTTISALISVIAHVVQFFQQNQIAADVLAAALIGIGVAIGAAVIPGMIAAGITAVASFGAWAVAAGVAAIATLAAAAPFILIGVIVAAVVLGIILAIQHWGQISAWLQGVWQAFSTWFVGAMNALGAWFVGVWQGIQSGLQAAWNFIVNVVKIGAQLVFLALFAPVIAIVALFQWLYNHNYYFKNLVDAIVNFFKACFAWLQQAWQSFVTWISGIWQSIAQVATTIWNAITSAIQTAVQAAWNWLVSIWTIVAVWLQTQWNQIAMFAQQAWKAVSGVFAGIWNNYIAGPLGSLWNQLVAWFSNLAKQFLQAGGNFIKMLVQGIQSGVGAIWNAVVNIAQTIWKALGFHSPPESGPAADSDTWMPNLINMLSTSLKAGAPKMAAAVNAVAKPLTILNTPATTNAPAPSSAASNGAGHTFNIAINGTQKNGRQLVDEIMAEVDRRVRRSGNLTTMTSGGRTA